MEKYNLIVIGSGPSGLRAAIQSAKLGKEVAVCERRYSLGGVCVNTGTIPSKTLREAVLFLSGYQYRGIYGPAFAVKKNIVMDDLLYRVELMIQREANIIQDQLKRNGVNLICGEASFLSPYTVEVSGEGEKTSFEAEHIVVATGTIPTLPEGIAVDGEKIILSDHVLKLKQMPKSMAVIGAGVIGTEYASMFAALGVKVILIDNRSWLLPFVDTQISDLLVTQMRMSNCEVCFNEDIDSVKAGPSKKISAVLKSGRKISVDVLLYSIGRVGATQTLRLENAGLSADERGRIAVNSCYQTEQPHIYGVGDVIGFPALASTSMEQGRAAACHAFGVPYSSLPELFPFGIYSIPEISMVGKSEDELKEQCVCYEVGVARYREIARGVMLGDDTGMLKLLFDCLTKRLLGVHIIGTSATELIHIGQTALAFGGGMDFFLDNVFNYPTFAECYKVAALDAYNKFESRKKDSV